MKETEKTLSKQVLIDPNFCAGGQKKEAIIHPTGIKVLNVYLPLRG